MGDNIDSTNSGCHLESHEHMGKFRPNRVPNEMKPLKMLKPLHQPQRDAIDAFVEQEVRHLRMRPTYPTFTDAWIDIEAQLEDKPQGYWVPKCLGVKLPQRQFEVISAMIKKLLDNGAFILDSPAHSGYFTFGSPPGPSQSKSESVDSLIQSVKKEIEDQASTSEAQPSWNRREASGGDKAGIQMSTTEHKEPCDNIAVDRRLYIGNLSHRAAEEDLRNLFGHFFVEEVTIVINPRTMGPVGYAFVTLYNPHEVERAITRLNGKDVLGRNVSVQRAIAPAPSSIDQPTDGHPRVARERVIIEDPLTIKIKIEENIDEYDAHPTNSPLHASEKLYDTEETASPIENESTVTAQGPVLDDSTHNATDTRVERAVTIDDLRHLEDRLFARIKSILLPDGQARTPDDDPNAKVTAPMVDAYTQTLLCKYDASVAMAHSGTQTTSPPPVSSAIIEEEAFVPTCTRVDEVNLPATPLRAKEHMPQSEPSKAALDKKRKYSPEASSLASGPNKRIRSLSAGEGDRGYRS